MIGTRLGGSPKDGHSISRIFVFRVGESFRTSGIDRESLENAEDHPESLRFSHKNDIGCPNLNLGEGMPEKADKHRKKESSLLFLLLLFLLFHSEENPNEP